MHKKEFLNRLAAETRDDEIVSYYDELISDRIEAGESESAVLASYDIKKIVRGLQFETAKKELEQVVETRSTTSGKKSSKSLVVILALCSAPITIPLGIAFIAILFSFLVVALSFFAASVAGVVFLVVGTIELITIGQSAAYIMFHAGSGLLTLGILGVIGFYGVQGMIKLYNITVVYFFRKTRKNKEVDA